MPCYFENTDHNSFAQGAAVTKSSGGWFGNSVGGNDSSSGRDGTNGNGWGNKQRGEYAEAVSKKYHEDRGFIHVGGGNTHQGIDAIYLTPNPISNSNEVNFNEVKYNTARLGKTRDGLQTGDEWLFNGRVSKAIECPQKRAEIMKLAIDQGYDISVTRVMATGEVVNSSERRYLQ